MLALNTLLDSGVGANHLNDSGETALYISASRGYTRTLTAFGGKGSGSRPEGRQRGYTTSGLRRFRRLTVCC